MADFDEAVKIVLKHEGGYVDNPNDKGGPTNFGISLRFLRSLIGSASAHYYSNFTTEDIKNLTEQEARDIYLKYFWKPNRYGEINNQTFANKVFDMAVNMGPGRVNNILQEMCQDEQISVPFPKDGKVSDRLIRLINSYCDQPKLVNTFLEMFKHDCIKYYKHLASINPAMNIFLKGWLNRVNS